MIRRAVFVLALAGAATLPVRAVAADAKRAEADAAQNTGRTYLAEGRAELALEQFKKALDLDDENYYAYKGLGLAYAQLKNYKEAEKVLQKVLALHPDFADARNDLAAVLMISGRSAEARKEWLAAYASAFNPTPDQTAWNLGSSYLEDKDLGEALRWFQSAVARNPSFARAQESLGAVLIAQGRIDEAIVHLEKVVKTLPDDTQLVLDLGDAYSRAGRFAEARQRLESVIKRDPQGDAGKQAAEMLRHFPK
jgi:type IV pilus assembly protein PilF